MQEYSYIIKRSNNMRNNETLITLEGLEELKRELEELKLVKRKEISEKIKAALAFGDISENAEYDEAKNEQANVEARIAKLENMIKNAKIISTTKKNGVVNIGSKVRIKDLDKSLTSSAFTEISPVLVLKTTPLTPMISPMS
jgi:transcription elongation GreA/GreB family factor